MNKQIKYNQFDLYLWSEEIKKIRLENDFLPTEHPKISINIDRLYEIKDNIEEYIKQDKRKHLRLVK